MYNAAHLRTLVTTTYSSEAVRTLFWLTVINGTISVIGLITSIKLANTLGKDAFGLYSYLLTIGNYAAVIIRYGRDRYFLRDLIHAPEKQDRIIAATLIMGVWLLSLVATGCAIYIIYFNRSPGFSGFLLIISICVASLDLQAVFDSWHRMTRHAIYAAISRLVYFLVTWTAFVFFPEDLDISYVAVASTLAICVSLALQYREVLLETRILIFNRENLKLASLYLRSNFSVALASLLSTTTVPLITIVLDSHWGQGEVGIYTVSFQITAIAVFFLSQIARIGNRAVARITATSTSGGDRRKVVLLYCITMFLSAAPIALPSIFFPGTIIGYLYKAEYAPAINALPIVGGYILIYSMGTVISQYFVALKLETVYLLSVVLGLVVGAGLSMTLIPKFGAVGASWTLLLSFCASMAVYAVAMLRRKFESAIN